MGKIVSANVSFFCKDFPSKGCIPASRTSQGAWFPRPTGPYRLTLRKEMIPQGCPCPAAPTAGGTETHHCRNPQLLTEESTGRQGGSHL